MQELAACPTIDRGLQGLEDLAQSCQCRMPNAASVQVRVQLPAIAGAVVTAGPGDSSGATGDLQSDIMSLIGQMDSDGELESN